MEQDDWTGLYEICLFVHELDIACTASTIQEYLVEQGCPARKATFLSHQYGHFLHILKLRDQRWSSPQPLGKAEKGTSEDLLQQKRGVWQVVAYEYHCKDACTIADVPPPPTRTFISQQAASTYIGRVVLACLKRVRSDAIGTDVLCQVKVLP